MRLQIYTYFRQKHDKLGRKLKIQDIDSKDISFLKSEDCILNSSKVSIDDINNTIEYFDCTKLELVQFMADIGMSYAKYGSYGENLDQCKSSRNKYLMSLSDKELMDCICIVDEFAFISNDKKSNEYIFNIMEGIVDKRRMSDYDLMRECPKEIGKELAYRFLEENK